MNSYIAKLALVYIILCITVLVVLVPVYDEIESQQQDEIQTLLDPSCPYCELREIYVKDGPLALRDYVKQNADWISFTFMDADEIEHISTSAQVQENVRNAISLITPDRLYVTFNINPSTGKQQTLIHLELDSYAIAEEYTPEPVNKAIEVASQISRYLSVSLLITVSIVVTLLISTLYISRKIFTRINDISAISESITDTGDLSQRIPVDNNNNEFNRLARQLNKTFATIENKVSDIRNMSNTLAHELKTPLTQLTHQIETLNIPHDEYVILKNSAEKATEVFNSILRIARLESGNAQLLKAPSDIDEIVTDAVDLLAPLAELKHQRIHIDIAPLKGEVDKSLIFQAFLNLLDNAIKYSPDGGEIKISSDTSKQFFRLTIENTCMTIAPEELGEFTERFTRGSNVGNNEGLGLGLPLVNAIACAHQGKLQLAFVEARFKASLFIPL